MNATCIASFFCSVLLLAPLARGAAAFDPVERAAQHPIVRDKPGPDFFEGALLGNGGLGAVVTTRPDAVVVHFGHNDVWDIRVSEENKDKIGTFQEVFEKVKAIPADAPTLESDPWYRDYMHMARDNYEKPYPRPFPCGSLVLGFDRRQVELLGYRIDIATGLCTVKLRVGNTPAELHLFADRAADRLWVQLTDLAGNILPNCLNRVRLLPDPDSPKDIPAWETITSSDPETLAFRQVLPCTPPVEGKPAPANPKDQAFRLSVRVQGTLRQKERLTWEGRPETMGPLERALEEQAGFLACVQLDHGLASDLQGEAQLLPVTEALFRATADATQEEWRRFWSRSGVALEDPFLEQVWYWNHYFFNCSAKAGVNCPGLFANWSYRGIGTAWHGDYHMNYNTQQPFWMPLSSNHPELSLPYVELVERLLPLSQKWAKEYYGLRGAYFPHSAYPVEMTISPYPVPTWGWEICETPWTVQGLWWHYRYTMDKDFLRARAFTPIRAAVLFLVDYMKRPEAHGTQWGDDKYHVFPTVPPELYGLKPGFKYNHDCLVDLTLIKFVMKAYLDAVQVLDVQSVEDETVREVQDILAHYPEYPTAPSAFGPIFVSVPGEHDEVVYNTPNPLMTVFPGEDHGLHSSPETLEMLASTFRNQQNEGGNDLVFLNLQAARLGLLDLDRFKRQMDYCLLENGTCTDMALQVHGRYQDTTRFDFMAPMGIWFENFGLPAVINECLLQSYNGTLRLFPNWPLDRSAAFSTLRAVGAFLVSASCANGQVEEVNLLSEAGGTLRVINPWKQGASITTEAGEIVWKDPMITMETNAGQKLRLLPL